jgi:hypothetical protein
LKKKSREEEMMVAFQEELLANHENNGIEYDDSE